MSCGYSTHDDACECGFVNPDIIQCECCPSTEDIALHTDASGYTAPLCVACTARVIEGDLPPSCGLCLGPAGEDGTCSVCEAAQCDSCGKWCLLTEDVPCLVAGSMVPHRFCPGCRVGRESGRPAVRVKRDRIVVEAGR